MKRNLLFFACVLPFLAYGDLAELESESSQIVTQPARTRGLCLKIDPLSDEQSKTGLSLAALRQEVVSTLENAGITVDDSLSQPCLTLRLRTIPVGLDLATFFQLSLSEDAMLARARSMFMAQTWAQASIMSCRPENLPKEAKETTALMAKAFAKDFLKAFLP